MKEVTVQKVQELIDAVEAEMKYVGIWNANRPPESAFRYNKAFASDTMAFEQWLQFVFIPIVREKIKTNGLWPDESEVGVYAVKNLEEGVSDKLRNLLNDFDELFNIEESDSLYGIK